MHAANDSDFLLRMAESSRARDARSRAALSDAQQRSLLHACAPPAPLVLAEQGFDVIAEIKRRSPAEGDLAARLSSPVEQARAYAEGGAAVLSVLTEPGEFHGSLDDLHEVANALPAVPVMRKDFLVSRYQVREARLAGASGVLLIAAMLEPEQLRAMLDAAFELDMFVLVEVFDRADLERCMPVLSALGAARHGERVRYLVGVNCRNLRTLGVDFAQFAKLAPELPVGVPRVAESGISDPAQASELAALGYRLALVGTLLMRSESPAETVRALRSAAEGAQPCS